MCPGFKRPLSRSSFMFDVSNANRSAADDVKELEAEIAKYEAELAGEVQENSNN